MELNRLTQKSQEALRDAQAASTRFEHVEVDGEHLLLALLAQPDGLISRILARMEIDVEGLIACLERELGGRPRQTGGPAEPGKVYVTQRFQQLIQRAEDEAGRLKDEFVSVEHLALALLSEGPETQAGRILQETGATREAFLDALTRVRGKQRVTGPDPEGTYEALEKYGVDLVAQAREGKLDPVIGRDAEIRRLVRILSRKTKNNPGSDRGARRGEDRCCRRTGAADRKGRRA